MRFYFDVISPYAYLAWHAIHPLAERHGRTVEPVPVLFAAMLNHHGNLGPAEIAPKRMYLFKNVVRLAHGLGVPLTAPVAHPFNPLTALRVAGLPMDEAARHTLISALFDAVWAGGPGVHTEEDVRRVVDTSGLDGAALVQAAREPEGKERLKRTTRAAIDAGVFGVPTVEVDGELFWGLDAFPHIDPFLAGNDPVDSNQVEIWRTLPAAARR